MKLEEVPPAELIADLTDRIANKAAGSFLRFNDGEGKIAGCPEFYSSVELTTELRTYFGTNALTNQQFDKLRMGLIAACRNADWIGVPRADWPPLYRRARQVLEGPIFGEHAKPPRFTHVSFPQIMLDSGAFKNILEGIDFLGLIGCRDLRRFFADNYGISNSWFINVPEQGGVAYSAYVPVHFPHYAEAILAGIKVPHPGAVFLVGAGVCGKLYCDVIKQRGGIAIDVGSLFDLWAGRFTRPYMNLGAIISYYQNRLDAGETGPEVFHAVADYHRARNDLANETALIDRAIECNPALFDFYYRKIDILLRQGLQTEAELFAHRAATQNFASGGPEAFRMAKLFLNTGNRDAGSAFLTIAINKTPTYAPALVELANFYMGPEEEFPPGALFDVPALIKTACADTADYQLLSQYARLVGAKGPFEDAIAIANRSTQLFSYDHYIYEQKSAWENALGLQEQASQSIATAASLQAAHV